MKRKKDPAIKATIEKIQTTFIELFDHYQDLHKKFDVYRGKKIEDEQQSKEINEILDKIRDTFISLSYITNFILGHHQNAFKINKHFNEFIHEMKKMMDNPAM